MSKLPLHKIDNQQDISLESVSVPDWMYRLWEWADENKIQEETIPRNNTKKQYQETKKTKKVPGERNRTGCISL